MDQLISAVKKEEEESLGHKKELTQSSFETLWKDYHSKIESITVLTALKNIIFEIAGTTINVTVPNERIKDLFVHDKEFTTLMNDSFTVSNIDLNCNIDLSKFPELEASFKVKKVLNNQEKFIHLQKRNPMLDELRKKFDLKIDKH